MVLLVTDGPADGTKCIKETKTENKNYFHFAFPANIKDSSTTDKQVPFPRLILLKQGEGGGQQGGRGGQVGGQGGGQG